MLLYNFFIAFRPFTVYYYVFKEFTILEVVIGYFPGEYLWIKVD
jgi:hypothetical protein